MKSLPSWKARTMRLPAATAPAAILSPQTASPVCLCHGTGSSREYAFFKHVQVAVVGYGPAGSNDYVPLVLCALYGTGGEMPDSEDEQVDGGAGAPEDLGDRLDDEIEYLTGTSGALMPGLSKVSCATAAPPYAG
jgi:hypothetical protein